MFCFTNNDMDKITENLWLGNFSAAQNVDNLKKEGISKILCLTDYLTPTYEKEDNFNQKVFKIEDIPTQNIIKYFGECIDFITEDEKILVHCMAGASRSATVVIAYIMWKEKISYDEALEFVSKKRSCVWHNDGFKDQLKIFDQLLKKNKYELNKINFNDIKWEVKLSKYW